MSSPVQPQPAAPVSGQGYSYPIGQLPPVAPVPSAQSMQPAQPQQAVPQPGQPGYAPVPAHLAIPGQNGPPAAAQPQFVPNLGATPQNQPAQPPASGVDLGAVLQGDNLPPQLRGRTVGDLVAQHTILMNAVRQGLPQVQQPAPAAPSQVPAASSMQPAAPPGQPPSTEFFRDPQAAIRTAMQGERQETVNAVLSALAPMLGPVVQNNLQQQMSTAINSVAQEIGQQRFQQLWPHIQQYVAGVPQNMWGNADTWRLAARTAAGDLALRGQPIPQNAPPAPQPSQNFGTPAAPYPVQVVGPNGQPVPGLPSFFTESPSGAQATGRVQMTPTQRHVFEQMRQHDPNTWHSEEVYLAWLGGVQPTRR